MYLHTYQHNDRLPPQKHDKGIIMEFSVIFFWVITGLITILFLKSIITDLIKNPNKTDIALYILAFYQPDIHSSIFTMTIYFQNYGELACLLL